MQIANATANVQLPRKRGSRVQGQEGAGRQRWTVTAARTQSPSKPTAKVNYCPGLHIMLKFSFVRSFVRLFVWWIPPQMPPALGLLLWLLRSFVGN